MSLGWLLHDYGRGCARALPILLRTAKRDDEALDALKIVMNAAEDRHQYSGQLKGLMLMAFDRCIGLSLSLSLPPPPHLLSLPFSPSLSLSPSLSTSRSLALPPFPPPLSLPGFRLDRSSPVQHAQCVCQNLQVLTHNNTRC